MIGERGEKRRSTSARVKSALSCQGERRKRGGVLWTPRPETKKKKKRGKRPLTRRFKKRKLRPVKNFQREKKEKNGKISTQARREEEKEPILTSGGNNESPAWIKKEKKGIENVEEVTRRGLSLNHQEKKTPSFRRGRREKRRGCNQRGGIIRAEGKGKGRRVFSENGGISYATEGRGGAGAKTLQERKKREKRDV